MVEGKVRVAVPGGHIKTFKADCSTEAVLLRLEQLYGVGVLLNGEGDSVLEDKLHAGSYVYAVAQGSEQQADSGDFSRFHESTFVNLRFLNGSLHEEPFSCKAECVLGSPGLAGTYLKLAAGFYGADVPEVKLLLVRNDVVTLYNEHIADGSHLWLLYLGQPGTGKSIAGLQLLFHFIKAGKTVVYHKQKLSKQTYYLFRDGRFREKLTYAQAAAYLKDKLVIYLEDGAAVENTDSVLAGTILVTSPEDKVSKDFRKRNEHPLKYYGTVWDKQEIEGCRRLIFRHISEAETVARIELVGCIPRLVFSSTKARFQSAWSEVVTELENAEAAAILKSVGKHDTNKKYSQKILCLERGVDSSSGYMVIASGKVLEHLALRCEEGWLADLLLKYKRLEGSAVYASCRGIAMEIMVHNLFPYHLSRMGQLCTGKHHLCHVPPMNLRRFATLHTIFYSNLLDLVTQLKALKEQGEIKRLYCRPLKKNEAAIDSLVVDLEDGTAYLLQMTVSSRHGTQLTPVNKLIFRLATLSLEVAGLYYVLGDNFDEFKYQPWRKMKKASDGVSYEEWTQPVKSLCQFKLMFDTNNALLLSVVSNMLKTAVTDSLTREESMRGVLPMREAETELELQISPPAVQQVPTGRATLADTVQELLYPFDEEDNSEADDNSDAEAMNEGTGTQENDEPFQVFVGDVKALRSGAITRRFTVRQGKRSHCVSLRSLQQLYPEVAQEYLKMLQATL